MFLQKSFYECSQKILKGDSGGPLVCETKIGGKVEKIQYGIVSWGVGLLGQKFDWNCGEKEYPGVYTNVAIHR